MSAAEGKQTQRMTPKGLSRDMRPSTFSTEWLTAKEAAAYLKVKHRTVCKWATQGKIPGHASLVQSDAHGVSYGASWIRCCVTARNSVPMCRRSS